MAGASVVHILLDTSYLWAVGFDHPDFRKLLRHSTTGAAKIFIPHIVWEERRTQFAEKVITKIRKLRDGVDALKNPWMGGLPIDGLVPPSLSVWSESEVETKSREAMAAFAAESKIEIVPVAVDHSERAWVRYFNADPPFDRAEDRTARRKDIPDSWIFEAAIDLAKEHAGLLALCGDGRLSKALMSIGVTVYKETQDILEAIDRALVPSAPSAEAIVVEPVPAAADEASAESKLETILAHPRARVRDVDTRILGYVGYLGLLSKDQLFDLLLQVGVTSDVARNVAERLTFEGLIKDTGNHYIPENKEACRLAALLVESEIIKLLES